ncbi:MFS family permease [Lysinibacter cavernae]|uniref:MFS family permease n=1 Tax=Lysinibacter cavernae TaxID=1640652 RepID=A0A7X5TSS1_9MICO|nr:MFS family permease [Lysinibacter cavernae]
MSPRPIPREVWVLVSASFVIALGYGIVAPVLPLYAVEFNVSNTAASAIISSFALMRLLFAPASGWLIQRFGEKRVYLSGLTIVAISTGACAFAQVYWQLLVLRSIAGIGSTMFTVAVMGLLIHMSPPDLRARISSLYAGSFLIGGIAGPTLGSLLAGLGLRAPFLIYALSLFVACIVVGTTLGKVSADQPGVTDSRPTMSLRAALLQPPYRAALASNFANGWSSFGVRVALVPLFMAAMSTDTTAAALALTAFAVGNAAVIIPAGRWSDLHGRRPFIIAGLAITGLSTVFFGFSSELWIALVLAVIAGVGTGLLGPSQQAAVADVIGQKARGGQVLSTFQMSADLGAVLGPLLIGLVADAFGFGPAFAVTGMLLLVAAVWWTFTGDTRERTLTQEIPIVRTNEP